MFSGITETIGLIIQLIRDGELLKVVIKPNAIFDDIKVGDSIAVNGVCLTATELTDNDFAMTIVPETLRLTNLNQLQIGSLVNLERSLKVGDRIGGHYVQGHIDTVGQIIEITNDGLAALLLKIQIPKNIAKYLVKKGYITIDGMSITLIDVAEDWFTVTLIPHTQQASIAHDYAIGTQVNIEVDILGKYIEKLMRSS